MALSISHHKIILNKYLCKKIESLLFLCVWRFEYRRRRLNSNYRVAKIILDMMEENDIFFVGGGDSIYLAKSVHKKYSTKFVWGHSFSAYASYDHFFNPLPLYAPAYILEDPLP